MVKIHTLNELKLLNFKLPRFHAKSVVFIKDEKNFTGSDNETCLVLYHLFQPIPNVPSSFHKIFKLTEMEEYKNIQLAQFLVQFLVKSSLSLNL